MVGGFLAAQFVLVWLAGNGPFVDEALYIVAGQRVLEGHGTSDGYIGWFNGSPFVWPVIAAVGHHLGGLGGARLMAALLSTGSLAAFAATADAMFGRSVATWCALALAVNGLFLALAHFAVYDVAALLGVAVSMWCVTHSTTAHRLAWPAGGAVAFALGVIAKYGAVLAGAPVLALLVARRGLKDGVRTAALFAAIAAICLAAYFWLSFGSLVPSSSAAYLGQAFDRTRSHIAALQIVFGAVPAALTTAGALIAWRRGQRVLAVTCVLALTGFPAFHVLTGNFVSGQKHVVFGFLFGYLLAGVALERLWAGGARGSAAVLVSALAMWGALQCYWQDRSWSDVRPLARYLAEHMARGERVVAESSWSYILDLYPRRLIDSPADVIDANYPPRGQAVDVCAATWLAGDPESAPLVARAIAGCRHRGVAAVATAQYYVDTSRLRIGVSRSIVGLFRRP